MAADPTPKPQDDETAFDGCARECRRAGTHTLTWGRCGHATDPRLPVSKDDLRGLLIAAGLVSHTKTMYDGYQSVVVHSDEEAADLALAVFREWMFGTPEEVAAREREAATRKPDDPIKLCEMIRPGEHEQRVRAKVADEILADVDHLIAGRREGAMWEAAYRAARVARGPAPRDVHSGAQSPNGVQP